MAEPKALTRDQDSLIQMQTRLVNQLTACLKEYYPSALTVFTGALHQKSALLLLQTYPTPQAAQAASLEQITHLLKSAGHTTAEKVAPKIFDHRHQPSLRASTVTTRTKSRLALALIAQLLPLIEQLFLSHEDHEVFGSLPEAGKRLAPRRLSEIGEEPSRYESAASLQALGGTSPVLFQSGNYSKPLRNALHQLARPRTQQESWANAYYERKRTEGKSHTVAIRALSNVWARILFAMLTTHQPCLAATFMAAKHLHAPKVA